MAKEQQPKNIFIIGAQCTGKTTLVNALQRYFTNSTCSTTTQTPEIISEVARTVLKQLQMTADDVSGSPERCFVLQKAILQAQFEAETRLIDRGVWYISDRSALDPVVYTKLFVSKAAMGDLTALPQWQYLEQNMRKGLVVLCESGGSWLVDDGVRLMPKDDEDWRRVDIAFRSLLEEVEMPYVLLGKHLPVAERVELMTRMLDTA